YTLPTYSIFPSLLHPPIAPVRYSLRPSSLLNSSGTNLAAVCSALPTYPLATPAPPRYISPICPSPTTSPSRPSMYTWLLLIARPIVTPPSPRPCSPYVEYVVSSVGPYRLLTLSTPASYNLLTTASGSASPARFTVFTLRPTPPCLSNSAMADGTVLISVTCSSCTTSSRLSAFSATTTLPPPHN